MLKGPVMILTAMVLNTFENRCSAAHFSYTPGYPH